MLGEWDDEALGYGRRITETFGAAPWRKALAPEAILRWTSDIMRWVVADTPGGAEAVAAELSGTVDERERAGLRDFVLATPKPPDQQLWAADLEFLQGELPPVQVEYLGVRLRDVSGRLLGTVLLYGPALPASILLLVSRGDQGMFGRMARRSSRGVSAPRSCSPTSSRRPPLAPVAHGGLLPPGAGRHHRDRPDDHRHKGIVGKHTGDGVSAFFLAHDVGGLQRRQGRSKRLVR